MIELLQKEVGLFTCGMFFEKAYENIDKNFPEILRVHAKSKHPMGGEFLFEKMNFRRLPLKGEREQMLFS